MKHELVKSLKSRKHSISYYMKGKHLLLFEQREREIFLMMMECAFLLYLIREEEEMCLIHFIFMLLCINKKKSFLLLRPSSSIYSIYFIILLHCSEHYFNTYTQLFKNHILIILQPILPIQISCITITTNIVNTNFQLLYNNYAI